MFTGIVEELGTVDRLTPISHGCHIRIFASRVMEDLSTEDSIAVSGVCLTVTKVDKTFFEVTAVDETLLRSTLSELKAKQTVNLERALRLNNRLGGHLVLGHVDGIGTIRSVVSRGVGKLFEIEIPEPLSRYTVEKGSITLDGVSLTTARVQHNLITISVVPYTLVHTTFGLTRSGKKVNIEVDILGKYIEKFLQQSEGGEKMGETWLRSLGY